MPLTSDGENMITYYDTPLYSARYDVLVYTHHVQGRPPQISLLKPDGSDNKAVANGQEPTMGQDGTDIYYISRSGAGEDGMDLFRWDLVKKQETRITHIRARSIIRYSVTRSNTPHGDLLLYSADNTAHLIYADGSGEHTLALTDPYPSAIFHRLRLSPAHPNLLFYNREAPGQHNLFAYDMDAKMAYTVAQEATHMLWSPDGLHIAYTGGSDYHFYITRYDGSDSRVLDPTEKEGTNYCSFAPEGDVLACSNFGNSGPLPMPGSIFLLAADGSGNVAYVAKHEAKELGFWGEPALHFFKDRYNIALRSDATGTPQVYVLQLPKDFYKRLQGHSRACGNREFGAIKLNAPHSRRHCGSPSPKTLTKPSLKSSSARTETDSSKKSLDKGLPWVAACLVLLLLGLPSRMAAQDQLGGPQGTVFTPALENIKQTGPTALFLTLRLDGTYDSNLVSNQYGHLSSGYTTDEGEAQYSLQDQSDNFLLTYIGGARIYPQYSNLNAAIQDGRLQWQRSLSKRSKFTATGRWASLPEGAYEQANPNQLFPLIGASESSATFLQQGVEITEGTVSFQQDFPSHISFIAGLNYDLTRRFGEGLIDTSEQDAYGGFYYSPSHRETMGLVYAHQWIQFSGGLGASQVDDVLASFSRNLSRRISVYVFGGPAFVSQTTGAAGPSTSVVGVPASGPNNPTSREYGFVGGGTFNAAFGHNKIQADYSRLVNNGSGFSTTVLRETGNVTVSRPLTARLEVALGGSYSKNLVVGAVNSQFQTYYIEPTIHYRVSPRLKFLLRYSEGRVTGLSQFGTLTRNQASVQLEYNFQEIPIRW